MTRRLLLAGVLLSACGGGSGGGAEPPDGFEPPPSEVRIERAFPLLSFTDPLFLAAPADGTDRIFVVERGGRIHMFPRREDAAVAEVFLDLRDRVRAGGEEGLLGLAFAPDFATSGVLYAFYTAGSPRRSVLSRFRATRGGAADPGSEEILLVVPQPFANHNGGMIAFGPDGMLYVGLGDGGSAGDPLENAQDPDSLLGKILRLDVDPAGPTPYGVLSDNPFAAGGGRPEIHALGFRNPWRFSFAPGTGELWVGDVGQGSREEIDVVVSGGNYGWDVFEGTAAFENPGGLPVSAFQGPILEYGRSVGASVIGGYVYRGASAPSLAGRYLYGDFVSGRIFALSFSAGAATGNEEIGRVPQLSSFGEDAAGELYAVSLGGTIHRFEE